MTHHPGQHQPPRKPTITPTGLTWLGCHLDQTRPAPASRRRHAATPDLPGRTLPTERPPADQEWLKTTTNRRTSPNPYAIVAFGILTGTTIGLPLGAIATWLATR